MGTPSFTAALVMHMPTPIPEPTRQPNHAGCNSRTSVCNRGTDEHTNRYSDSTLPHKTPEPTPKHKKSRSTRASREIFSLALPRRPAQLPLPPEVGRHELRILGSYRPQQSFNRFSLFFNPALEQPNHFNASRRQSFFAQQHFESKQKRTQRLAQQMRNVLNKFWIVVAVGFRPACN